VEFRLVTLAEARREGDSTLAAYARRWLAGRTLRLEGAPTPKLAEGALCLNDPETAEACLATLEVTRQGAVSQ
jgi:hypothetical protein